ncbi:DUF3558 domain-containing protein [Saccharopolyspora elongata]|uniref:DUF3558 domain-containing protein n=1 Tax=Saccharopolyspora elongata TaxID=2530387 RepID=UPI0022A71B68|nr:DUF3558 domain-containing protein [Saccharopolyspora elongata]
MRVHRLGGLIALTAATALLAGCTVNGPDAEPTSEPTSTPTSGSGASLELPPRPRDLPVGGAQDAEICSWLLPEQQAQLQVARPRPAVKNGNNYNGCIFNPDGTGVSAGVALRVVPEGLDAFVQKVNSAEGSRKVLEVKGFGAVQSQIAGAERLGCSVFVDAAQGQTLYVDLNLLASDGMDNNQMCERAKQAAEAAVTTLQGS